MNNDLEARRQQLLRALAHVNRQIAKTQKSLENIDKRLAVLQQANDKAA